MQRMQHRLWVCLGVCALILGAVFFVQWRAQVAAAELPIAELPPEDLAAANLPQHGELLNQPWNANIRVNDTARSPITTPRDEPVLAGSLSSTELFAVWVDGRNGDGTARADTDLLLRRSADGGSTWGDPLMVGRSAPGRAQSAPDAVLSAAGRLHGVWVEKWADEPIAGAIFYAYSDNDGMTWSIAEHLNDVADSLAVEPAIAVDGSTVCVAWSDDRTNEFFEIYVDCSTNTGMTWGKDVRISSDIPGTAHHRNPDIAFADSRVHVVWEDYRAGNADIYYAYRSGANWSANVRISHGSLGDAQEFPALAAYNRALYVVWRDSARLGSAINGNISTDAGDTWLAVDQEVSDMGGVSDRPALTLDSSGTPVAAWRVVSGTQTLLYADRRVLTTWGTDELVVDTTSTKQHLALAAGSSRVNLAWSTGAAIVSAYRTTTWSAQVAVSDEGEARQQAPALAAGTVNYYAAWLDYRSDLSVPGVRVARSTDGGATWSSNILVNDAGHTAVAPPALAATGAVTVHAAWRGSASTIYYDRSTTSGATWGTDVNLGGGTGNIAIAADASNGVYVVWPGIFMARSLDSGTTWGAAVRIISQAFPLVDPALAVGNAGSLHLAWAEEDTDQDVCHGRSTDRGVTWTDIRCFSAPYGTAQTQPDIAVDPISGRVHATWQDARDGVAAIYHAYSSDNGVTWSTPARVNDTLGPAQAPRLVVGRNPLDSSRVVYIVWQDTRDTGHDDIFYARSTNQGVTWGAAGRVNDDSFAERWPQRAPDITANANGDVLIGWEDLRRSTWDIFAATIAPTCPVPLYRVGMIGDWEVDPGATAVLTGLIDPLTSTIPLDYIWEPSPHRGQGTTATQYTWPDPGVHEITFRAANCGGTLAATHVLTVTCPAAITDVSITEVSTAEIHSLVRLEARLTPIAPYQPITYTWSPEPDTGQNTSHAHYTWHTLGSRTITLTVSNCSGIWGVFSTTQTIHVVDTQLPVWNDFQPTGWVTQTTGPQLHAITAEEYVTMSVRVQDVGSGLDVSTAQAMFTTNGGSSWTAYEDVYCPGGDGTLTLQKINHTHDFGQDSTYMHLNRVRFRIADMAGNYSYSPVYNVDIDTTPPLNPTTITGDRATSAWSNDDTATMSWSYASDASSGVYGYSYQWSMSSTTLPDALTDTVGTSANTTIPSNGNAWYFHVRTVDNVGHWAESATHKGPYWLDTNAPQLPTITSVDPPTGTVSSDNTITVVYNSLDVGPSGIAGYSRSWTQSATDIPDDTLDTGNTSPILSNGTWYFHVKAQDRAGNWSATRHVGPFIIDFVMPAVILLDHGSGSPGSDVYVIGAGYEPNITVTLSFRRQPDPIVVPFTPLGDFLTSPDGTFQVLATVPLDALTVLSEFRAASIGKSAQAEFDVTDNMTLVLQPNRVRPGQNFTVQASGMNPNGSLYIETDLGHALGAFPLNGATSKTQQIHISSAENYSATHILTATVRVGGTVVMRKTATFAVYQTALGTPPPSWITTAITHGIRGDAIGVTGYHNWADLGSCVIDPEYWHGQTDVTGKHIFVPSASGSGGEYWCGMPSYGVTLRATGGANYGAWLYTLDNPGAINVTATVPDDYIDASVDSDPPVALWPVAEELPYGQYEICLTGKLQVTEPYEEIKCSWDSYGQQHCSTTTKYHVNTLHREVLACTPFRLDPAPRFTGQLTLNDPFTIQPDDLPQIIVSGKTIGTLGGQHPVTVSQTFIAVDNPNIRFDLPEGAYTFTAFACNHKPVQKVRMVGRGTNIDMGTLYLAPTDKSGPAILGVEAQIESYLDDFGKVGPFLSLQGVPHSLPPLPITFRIRFDTSFETIESVKAELAGQDTVWATQDPADTNYWNLTLPNLHTLPAGELNMRFIAYGHYKGGCGEQLPAYGPEFIVPIVMAEAPPWLKAPSWGASFAHGATITYNAGEYVMAGTLGIADRDAPIPLGFLGSIENSVGAAVSVNETFSTRTGIWSATAEVHGGAEVLCYSAMPASLREKCARNYTMHFTAVPAGGAVQVAGQPSYPARYTGNIFPIMNETFGPFEVYNGMVASYWGVVNVNLSISFGARAFLNLTPEMEADLSPALTFTPGAEFTGSISLWVDILMGVASAGVTAEPSLGLAFPITLSPSGFALSGPDACLRLRGSVWFKALWWKEEFGPATILEVESSDGACGIIPMAQATGFCYANSTPPPATMPAPALAVDGYGHVMATWVHDASNDPAKSEGVLYAVYFDGASWSEAMPVAGPGDDPTLLVSDPAIDFAGDGVAVAIYAVNARNATNPGDWDAAQAQLANQTLYASVWQGTAWQPRVLVASGGGPHGRVSLAGDPANNRALALWIHDVSTTATKKWRVEYSVFNAATGAWTARAPIVSAAPNQSPPPTGSIDAEVALAFDSAGRAMATWIRQSGILPSDDNEPEEYSAFNRNDQRRLVVATWEPSTDVWTVSVGPMGLPLGALMPDVAFDDQDQPVLAYALYLQDRDGVTPTGLGNNNHLGYAVGSALGLNRLANAQSIAWESRVAPNLRGIERPRVIILPEEQATVVYRGFDAQNTNGALSAITVDLRLTSNFSCTLPGHLTYGSAWMLDAVAYRNRGSGLTTLLAMGAFNLGGQRASAALPGVSIQNVSLPGDEVMAIHLPVLPDLSISTEDLRLTETLPLSGTLVPVSVNARNLGLARTHQPVTVQLLAQHVATGKETLIVSDTIPSELMFNETFTLSGAWPARAGLHRIIARVSPPLEDDVDGSNNEVHVLVGAPAQPTGLTGSRNTADASITLTWRPEAGAALGHYRIYRAAAEGELLWLADSTAAWFRDTSVESSTTYTYTVSAVSDAEVESPQSAELSIGPALRYIYLPLVMKP